MTPSSEEGLHGGGGGVSNTVQQQQEEEPPISLRQGHNRTGWTKEDEDTFVDTQEGLCRQAGEDDTAEGLREEWDNKEERTRKDQEEEEGGEQGDQVNLTAAASSTKPTTTTNPATSGEASLTDPPPLDTGAWPPSLRVRRPGEALHSFLRAANADVSAETMQGVTPSFADALEWVRARSSDLNGALRLVHLYPNLIQADCLDGLWDFLLPFIQRGTGLKVSTLEEQHLAMHGGSEISTPSTRRRNPGRGHPGSTPGSKDYGSTIDKASSPRLIYVSCNKSSNADLTGESGSSFSVGAIDRLIMALSSHCFVHCSPLAMPPVSTSSPGGWPHTVHHAQVMVVLMDTHTLNSDICMKELEEALRHSTPVVMVRGKDYQLPDAFPVGLQNVRIPRHESGRNRESTVMVSSIRSTLVPKADDFRLPKLEVDSPIADNNVKRLYSLSHAGITLRKSSTEEDCSEATLEDYIRKLMPKAVEYSDTSHDSCFAELHRRLESHIGKGISPRSCRSKNPDSQTNVRERELLLNVGCLLPTERLSGGSGSSLNVHGEWRQSRSPRAISVRSAPEYRQPSPLSCSLPEPNQDPKARPQNTINGYTLLPPIDATAGGGPLRKHHSQELPPLSPRLDFYTDRRTNYLLLRKPGSGAELVPWPPEERKEQQQGNSDSLLEDALLSGNDSEELSGLRCDSDSDSSLTVALSSNDINLGSLSPTPDFV